MNEHDLYDTRSRWFRRGVWAALAIAGVGGALVYRARPSNQPKTPAELIRIVRDPAATSAARHAAAAALSKLPGATGPQVVPLLVDVLETGDDQARFLAMMALERLGTKAIAAKPALIEATTDLNPNVRQFAVRTLVQMGPDDELVATFAAAARDAHADVRQEAFGALRFQKTGVVEALVALLADDDAGVRRLAASELSRLRSHVEISGAPLHRALADDLDPIVRAEALAALRNLSLLTSDELVAACRDSEIRATAFKLLRNRLPGDAVVVPELRRLLKSDDADSARGAAMALGALGPVAREALDDILACVDDEREPVRDWVRLALRPLGLEGAYRPPDLWGRLADANEGVKSLVLSHPAHRKWPPLGDQEMEHLAGLVNLRYLDLSFTDVGDAGLAHLVGLTKLEWLLLFSTRVTSAGLAHLAGLSNLRELQLGECQVTDDGLAQLKTLEKLERLYLAQTGITDTGMPSLAGLRKLKVLYLHNTQVTDAGLAHLSQLDQLCEVGFDKKRVTTQGLAQLRGLTTLRLNDAPIGDADLAPLGQLVRLETLSLARTSVSDAGLAPLYGLKRLKWLDLTKTRVTPAGVAKIKNALPHVQVHLY